ncbi:MAG: hypothetical protein L3J35_12560 [Bacteroidales bacterium]|nr:hypothetical protein [Bacteroidales bacterium]
MKKIAYILLFLMFSFFNIHAQTYDIFEGDTINYTDANHNKQGYWVVFKNRTSQKLQEGMYFQGKKDGVWKSYYVNGNLKSLITYVKGEKSGEAKIYYENGNIAEEGTWVVDKWVGKYKSYYKNGKLSYLWNYNDYGNRSGYQQYFYKNGNKKIEGEWIDGKEHGVIKEYYETGTLRVEKNFSLGECDSATIKTYSENEIPDDIVIEIRKDSIISKNSNIDTIVIEKNDSLEIFSGTGYHIFYNINKRTEKEGEFVNGILINGKQYFYNNSGELEKTAIYKNGKIVKFLENKKQ